MSESWSNDERPEDGVSLTSEEKCFIDQLPNEVLRMIFGYVSDDRRFDENPVLILRGVCESWWDILSQDLTLYFRTNVRQDILEKCTFRSIGLKLHDVDLNKQIPPSVWEKIGCRVHSVVLDSCKLGDEGLKNLIVHCENLRSLRVVLRRKANNADVFCSPNMLKELNITRRNLETFEIFNRRKTISVLGWIQIVEALLKVYPNITHFSSGCGTIDIDMSDCSSMWVVHCNSQRKTSFQLKFLKELVNDDFNGIVSSLVFSLSPKNAHRIQALDAFSTLNRLINVSIRFDKGHYSIDDRNALSKVFRKHKDLKSVELMLKERPIPILEFLLLDILQHCPNLNKLLFPLSVDQNSLYSLSESEFVKFCTKLTGLKEVLFDEKSLLIKGSLLKCDNHLDYGETCSPLWDLILQKFMMTHYYLQHLDLKYFPCTDEILQNIFKYLVNLKTLSIRVTIYNTCSGLIGRCENVPDTDGDLPMPHYEKPYEMTNLPAYWKNFLKSVSGYSIKRLKYLEELTIKDLYYTSMGDTDTIFNEFVFPKLHYLKVDPPNDPVKFLPIMAKNMPLLKTIKFTRLWKSAHNIGELPSGFFSFCGSMKNLRTIILDICKICFQGLSADSDFLDVFKTCPSLRIIRVKPRSASYDPVTRTVLIKIRDKVTTYVI